MSRLGSASSEPSPPAPQSSGTAASSSARASAKEDLVVEAVEVLYDETPLGILQTMLTLPESDREAAGPDAPAGVRAARERGRQQQQGARASPSAGISRGFVQRHNKSVASALSAQEVKVGSVASRRIDGWVDCTPRYSPEWKRPVELRRTYLMADRRSLKYTHACITKTHA
jgi:hypothetical protein